VADHEPHVTDDEAPAHRHERPEDWGWHGEFGRWARVAGWLCAALLVVLNLTTHYNESGGIWLDVLAGLLVLLLIRDWYRRRNAWRE
jgi:Protein of unknown function (DUF2631)